MSLLQRFFPWLNATGSRTPAAPTETGPTLPNESPYITSEQGLRTTPENQLKYLYRLMWVDYDVRNTIMDIRRMDRIDPRVKRVHRRIARDAIKGGLVLTQITDSPTLRAAWATFNRRLQLNRVEKLKSDAVGLVMEGNLPLQMVLDESYRVSAAIRMPSETILPNVDSAGRYIDPAAAHFQLELATGAKVATFPLWQLFLARFDPDNFDDLGAMGRPFLDATRSTWKKLQMTEEDLVIRRRTRAPLRLAHVLEGATPEQLDMYRSQVEKDQSEITTDYYLNRKGGVTSIQGDVALHQIADVTHLLDSFFAGTPLPKGMVGYTDGLARDILEDLKRDYYEEVDSLQDTLSFTYEWAFRLDLLLQGINPDADEFAITFAERQTETPNQTADRALKWQALGLPQGTVWEELGFNATDIRERLEEEAQHYDPYPAPGGDVPPGTSRVKITPGNGRKGESGTSIANG